MARKYTLWFHRSNSRIRIPYENEKDLIVIWLENAHSPYTCVKEPCRCQLGFREPPTWIYRKALSRSTEQHPNQEGGHFISLFGAGSSDPCGALQIVNWSYLDETLYEPKPDTRNDLSIWGGQRQQFWISKLNTRACKDFHCLICLTPIQRSELSLQIISSNLIPSSFKSQLRFCFRP